MEPSRYVDVNVFVYWLGKHPKFGETAQDWIGKIEDSNRKTYITSSLTMYETLVVMSGLTGRNLKERSFVDQVVSSFQGLRGLAVEPLKLEDFVCANNLMNDCKIDYEDALHLAVAMRVGVREIISNDKDFDAANIERVF